VKRYCLAFSLLLVFIIGFSCKKINEATELGSNLIPAVDNVNTFEVALNLLTANHLFLNDSTRVIYSDDVALGDLQDPEFGHTHANFDFGVSPTVTGTYPFIVSDSLSIDSVVLSLSYAGGYGDTVSGFQTIRVYEVDPNSGFKPDTLYRYSDPASDFGTTGPELGSATFQVSHLKDSITIARPGDTTRVNNVIRIKFNDTSLGHRFAQYDTSSTSPNGGFYSDSIFRTLFKGFAIHSDNSGNVLTYWNLANLSNSKLSVYFTAINNGDTTKSSVNFTHAAGQSNYIQRDHSSNLSSGGDDKLYVQSTPGSYVGIKIPGLDAFNNKVIHRAEIIATRIPSASDNIFTPPSQLIIDRLNNSRDTAFILQNDLTPSPDGSIAFSIFGGNLRWDNTYHFNITRHVQGIVTRHEPNDSLRLYAPLRTILFATNLPTTSSTKGSYIAVPGVNHIAEGRVVLGGGNNADSSLRLRLRIIYSNL
jgi:hypothetical protein